MNGAESLVHSLINNDIEVCFTNPGTSEMHFVAALDRVPGLHCVLGLFEGVVTGAADGYYRMTDKPAATLLHCGPGLANGLSNLHNARRARSGVVNIPGDQATYHRPLDAPLTADTEGWARGVSAWVRTANSSKTVGADTAQAVLASRLGHGQIATLILPADTAWGEGGVPGEKLAVPPRPTAAPQQVKDVAALLRRGEPTILVLGGTALREDALADAHRIAAATGAKLIAEGSNARTQRGRGRLPLDRVPYVVDQATKVLAPYRHVVLVGSIQPTAFFAYPNKPGYLTAPGAEIHVLCRTEQDPAQALAALASELGAPRVAVPAVAAPEGPGRGKPTLDAIAQTVAAMLPEQAIVVDESVTTGRAFFPLTYGAAPHDWLQNCGGSIGYGPPLAVGAAVACPDRRVVALQADGSAMYTLQALWTQARENLDITTVIFSNRKYQILIGELANVGANPGRTALDMLDLGNPDLDWTKLAAGMGVEAARATTCEELASLMAGSFKRKGPFLIELVM
jgi:acetolactate synthase-1/2/3 large subunit